MSSLHDATGTIHIHSAYSYDGRVPVPRIMAAAQRCGLDFVMLTDHETLQARQDGLEGWHSGTLLVVGQEVAPRFNHYLVFGMDTVVPLPPVGTPPQFYVDAVNAVGGIGLIAHPDHEGTSLFRVKPYPWRDWSVRGFTGMSIWDFMTDWQCSLRSWPTALLSYWWPGLFLTGPKQETLARWDRLNHQGRLVGFGELDNHATRKRIGCLTLSVFPFIKAFRFVRTHLLTEEPLTGSAPADITTLLQALRRGRAYFSQECFCPAAGFSFSIAEGRRRAWMGDELILVREAVATVVLPAAAVGRIRLLCNGRLEATAVGGGLSRPVATAGAYRVEVELHAAGRYRPWIFSNPIYVRTTAAPGSTGA